MPVAVGPPAARRNTGPLLLLLTLPALHATTSTVTARAAARYCSVRCRAAPSAVWAAEARARAAQMLPRGRGQRAG
jgi:hypothetical protein